MMLLCNVNHMIIYFGMCFPVDEYNYTSKVTRIQTVNGYNSIRERKRKGKAHTNKQRKKKPVYWRKCSRVYQFVLGSQWN